MDCEEVVVESDQVEGNVIISDVALIEHVVDQHFEANRRNIVVLGLYAEQLVYLEELLIKLAKQLTSRIVLQEHEVVVVLNDDFCKL